MKIRVQDSSVRFRITLKELEVLRESGVLARETRVPAVPGGGSGGGSAGAGGWGGAVFRYEVRRDSGTPESAFLVEPFALRLILAEPDFQQLADPANEGAYIRREWADEEGQPRRFMVFIEKDRPGSTCIKQEAWIYELDYANSRAETRPIPKREKNPA